MGLELGTPNFAETGVGTNAGVTVTHAAPAAGSRHMVSGIAVSGDAAAVVTIESPAATVLWTLRYAAAFDRAYSFAPEVIRGPDNAAVLVKISASTSHCEANIQGYTVPTI